MPQYSVDVWYKERDFFDGKPSNRIETLDAVDARHAKHYVRDYLKEVGKAADILIVREGL